MGRDPLGKRGDSMSNDYEQRDRHNEMCPCGCGNHNNGKPPDGQTERNRCVYDVPASRRFFQDGSISQLEYTLAEFAGLRLSEAQRALVLAALKAAYQAGQENKGERQ